MVRSRHALISILIAVALLALWEVSVRLSGVASYIMVPPSDIGRALWNGFARGLYPTHLWITLVETLAGFAIGAGVGICIGALIALNPGLERFLMPYMVMFQSVPKVALAPLIIIWFGLGLWSKIVMAAMICFFPILVNTIAGFRSAEADRQNLLMSMTATRWQILLLLQLPSALPFIFAGLEIGITLSLLGAIVAEFLGGSTGLGMLLTSMNFSMDIAGVFSVLVVLSIMGWALTAIISFIRKKVLFWENSAPTNSAK